MPRKKPSPGVCICGCNEPTLGYGRFKKGHDMQMLGNIVSQYGGILKLKEYLENKKQEAYIESCH